VSRCGCKRETEQGIAVKANMRSKEEQEEEETEDKVRD
jgi:hypothetical protein